MPAQLGRIGGSVLQDNLLRDGVDLVFKNAPGTDPILYLDVNSQRLGVGKDNPAYDLDINSDLKTDVLDADTLTVGNIIFRSNGSVTTVVGPINIIPSDPTTSIDLERLTTDDIIFNDNTISSSSTNTNIDIEPSGSGETNIDANTNITGNLGLTGNILVDGNLSSQGNIIVGDSPLDTITIAPDLTQDIVPGQDNRWDLGQDANDSSPIRFADFHVPDLTKVDTMRPSNVIVSDQMILNGVSNQIFALQSNDDILLSPDTGITYIESTKWQNNDVTNLNTTTPLQFASTGIGYLRFDGTNGFVLPAGSSATRPGSPELGDTRWNTDEQYLECFDGSVYVIATGGGEEVTTSVMEDLGNVYALILA